MEKIYEEPDRTKLIDCLMRLGFADTDSLIIGLRSKKPVDLDASDANQLTPLRIAIQRLNINDKEIVKTLYSYSTLKVQSLTDYDKAVIAEVVKGKTKSGWFGTLVRKDLPVPNHRELFHCFQVFYNNSNATYAQISYGIAAMSRQAFFSEEMKVFRNRLANLKSNVVPIIEAAINKVKPKVEAEIIADARNKGINPVYDFNRVFKEVRDNLKNKFPATVYTDLWTFWEEVTSYFDPKRIPKESYLPSEQILSGFFTTENLPVYFKYLKRALEKVKKASFVIHTGNHEFTLYYKQGQWIYDDVDHLEDGRKQLNEEKIILLLCKYFSRGNSPLILSVKP